MNNPHSLVIGGTRGIGLALVKLLAENGHQLSVIGRRPATELEPLPSTARWSRRLSEYARIPGIRTLNGSRRVGSWGQPS